MHPHAIAPTESVDQQSSPIQPLNKSSTAFWCEGAGFTQKSVIQVIYLFFPLL